MQYMRKRLLSFVLAAPMIASLLSAAALRRKLSKAVPAVWVGTAAI